LSYGRLITATSDVLESYSIQPFKKKDKNTLNI